LDQPRRDEPVDFKDVADYDVLDKENKGSSSMYSL